MDTRLYGHTFAVIVLGGFSFKHAYDMFIKKKKEREAEPKL